jgi:hypothetical protein
MREMEAAGVMDIQSHAMTHTWYPSGPKIVDFRHPGDDYVWMDWNASPERKWDYLRSGMPSTARWGEPVYEHSKSLAGRRFFPDTGLSAHLAGYATAAGNGYFSRADWRENLTIEAERYRAGHCLEERFENEAEYLARLQWELGDSKRLIEANLGKTVEFLCWPGGGYGQEAVAIARRFYSASTLSSGDRGTVGLDASGHLRIARLGVPHIEKRGEVVYPGGRYIFHYLRECQGSGLTRLVRQGLKLLFLAKGIDV